MDLLFGLSRTQIGSIAAIVGVLGYVPYLLHMWRGETKPHAFSWLIWALLTTIGCAAQISDGGGPGSWATGVTAAICFVIFLFSLRYGERAITRSDWISLLFGVSTIPLWLLLDDPLISVILITIIDGVGFYPTFRKSYLRPFEETTITYVFSALKFTLSLLALDRITFVTSLYPVYLVLVNGVFVVVVLYRRRVLSRPRT